MQPSSTKRTIDDRDIVDKYVLSTGLVCDKPFWLLSLVVASGSPAIAYMFMYDGVDDTAERKFSIYARGSLLQSVVFERPVRFQNGLYAWMPANARATLRYVPDY